MRHGCEGRDPTNKDISLAAWVGTGGTWLVHCVAKTVVLNNRHVSLKMDVYDEDTLYFSSFDLIFVPGFPVCCVSLSLSVKNKPLQGMAPTECLLSACLPACPLACLLPS